MAYEALIERIKKLDVQTIEKMSPEVLARLTHNFEESLVKQMLYTVTTNLEQRKVIRYIMKAFQSWKKNMNASCLPVGLLPKVYEYPEYMNDLQMDIECGMVITEKGIFPEKTTRLKISLIPAGADPIKAIPKESQQVLHKNEEKPVASNQSESYIENLNKQLAEQKNENENLKAKINTIENQLQPDEKLTEEQKMGIDERIILISTALGITLSAEDINQSQLAQAIEHFSGDDWRSIRSRIVKINKGLLKESETPGDGLSQGTLEAVKNVKEWLEKIGKTEIAPATKNLIKEIDEIYLNKKE